MWTFGSSSQGGPENTISTPNLLEERDARFTSNVSDEIEPDKQAEASVIGIPNERLSIPFLFRAPLLLTASFVCGFSLGSTKGSRLAADRYRAENTHRLPTTQYGWFLYQKSKNYHAILGGVKEGVKFGSSCSGWASLFMVTEEILDQSRGRLFARGEEEIAPGQKDAANSVIAALSMAGIYSWRHGLDKFAAAKTARLALKYSLIYGLLQDLAASVRGNRPAYIDWVARRIPFGQQIGDNG